MGKAAPSLAEQAAANSFRFFSFEEIGEIFGFGRDTLTAIVAAGAPVVARKINPSMLLKWLTENADSIGKIRAES